MMNWQTVGLIEIDDDVSLSWGEEDTEASELVAADVPLLRDELRVAFDEFREHMKLRHRLRRFCVTS